MSDRELAKSRIDKIPNTETLEAFTELKNGGGYTFSGTTE